MDDKDLARKLSGAGVEVRARVVCTAPEHPTKTATVATFLHITPITGQPGWSAGSTSSGGAPFNSRVRAQSLDDDEQVDLADYRRTHPYDARRRLRQRYVMRCPLCRRTVTARAERLYPVLDELTEAWAPRPWPMLAPLSVLAGRLSP